MKKVIFGLLIFILNISFIYGYDYNTKYSVKFLACVDGDTAKFILNEETITVRFLAVDTPEVKHPTKGVEPYGKEASNYTCDSISKGKNIAVEFDKNSDLKDKYNRYLVWIFVDNNLLNNDLIRNGYGRVAYLYGNYKYTSTLKVSEEKAKQEKIGVWSDYQEDNNNLIVIGSLILLIVLSLLGFKIKKRDLKKLNKKLRF